MTKKLFISIISFYIVISSTFAQDQKEMSPEEKAWMKYMTPGKEHEELAQSVGEWVYESKFWMDPSNPEPMITTGEAEIESVFEGRYFQMNTTGTMMGMPFYGIGVTGYDNAEKVYVSSWIDNLGTGMIMLKGKKNSEGQIDLKGSVVDPMTGMEMQMRELITIVDENTQRLEMFVSTPNGEFKNMEINFSRKP